MNLCLIKGIVVYLSTHLLPSKLSDLRKLVMYGWPLGLTSS